MFSGKGGNLRKLLLAALAALLAAGSAGAIVGGEPDGDRHPYVGLIGFFDADGNQAHICSGTLVSPRVVVTAGHCTFETSGAVVWFDSQALAGPPTSGGMTVTHPDFNPVLSTPTTGDLGVVLLARPVVLPAYGSLPAAGLLDAYASKKGKQDLDVTLVGYGLQSVKPAVFTAERMLGRAQIRNVNNALVRGYGLQTSNSRGNGTGGGGTCSGDSGGPILQGDSDVVLAVNSFGKNQNCVGNDYSYRVDTPTARAFLSQFVPVP